MFGAPAYQTSLLRWRFCAWLQKGCGHGLVRGNAMITSAHARRVANLAAASGLALLLGACGGGMSLPSFSSSSPPPEAEPGTGPEMPASIRADEIVGRWGLASFQNPADRARTEAAARSQCKNPYVIGAGTSGGVVMHLADQATPQELRLKGSPSGKNYIGPAGPTPGEQDREIVSFDGRVLITRFIDKDAATRYGNMVYVRCAPRA
ncbi:bll7531 [Bradyrhizobium diazoefficiens USDA 110]|uniref:Bll7531 protein n=3 Tax=Bradyrhizobium diazoefficiens TaxID=1355477 RepID=Q89DA8_BRADU|nr:hypothetical protein CO678_32175 [Bradyrhizobium diazoefficiens]QBP26273.1 hypothetical protein Bdiaspc4_39735 [Bradyrhizobium diazoefficiens]BAC52796.1 bll7531 [Bradyrhizobium diazoefficiens USDA 110]